MQSGQLRVCCSSYPVVVDVVGCVVEMGDQPVTKAVEGLTRDQAFRQDAASRSDSGRLISRHHPSFIILHQLPTLNGHNPNMPPKKHQTTSNKRKGAQPPAAILAQQHSISWPPLTPLLPPSDLELREALPEQILTIPRFFTSTLCKTYVNYLQKSVSLTTTPGKPKRGEAVRVNDRYQIQDAAFAERLWNQSGLKDVVSREDSSLWGGEVVGLNPK